MNYIVTTANCIRAFSEALKALGLLLSACRELNKTFWIRLEIAPLCAGLGASARVGEVRDGREPPAAHRRFHRLESALHLEGRTRLEAGGGCFVCCGVAGRVEDTQ